VDLRALVGPLRGDVVSGAAVIGRTASDVVRRAVRRIPVGDAGELREMLVDLSVRILDAQPAMAPLVSLTSAVLTSFEPDEPLEDARSRVLEAAAAFKDELESSVGEVARAARPFLPPGGRILTLSSSSTVRKTLLLHGEELKLRACCLEGRPLCEGKHVARELARAGIPVTYAVDAAAGSLLLLSDLVLLGADSVGDDGIVNKIGSLALAALASEFGVPLYVLVDRTKLLPPGFPQDVRDRRPEEEVWKPPHGVKVWNRYFECIPLNVVHGLVTEEGVLSSEDLERIRSRIPVPPELREWAEAAAT
jgi:translation initiation factor eIF-2B subunit delta